MTIEEYMKDQIYIVEYPVRFAGMDIFSRMTIVRLNNGKLWVHSPCKLDSALKAEIDKLGNVAYIIAPGNYHHLHVGAFQAAYPNAETFLCPRLEKERPDLVFDWVLGNHPDIRWECEFDQVVVRGTRFINEVAFYHRPSKVLILVDLIENIGDDYTHDAGLLLQFWWKLVLRMWNNPKPAPEYQMGWGDKSLVRQSLDRILTWDFEKIILAHGNLIEKDAHRVAAKAWQKVLTFQG